MESRRLQSHCICVISTFSFILVLMVNSAFASQVGPNCLDRGVVIPTNDEQVLNWKHTTQNQFRARAHVQGVIEQIYKNKNGHQHFEIRLGPVDEDTLEIVYNESFGVLPELSLGMIVEACGDYITSTANTVSYSASPAGAIMHWVHKNPSSRGHESGYLIVNGILYGQSASAN